MPQPITAYATLTLQQAPSSALTDFTHIVDLSRLGNDWWSAVDTSDGTKGRAYKADGTELACDWIDFNNVAKTGWVRIKWTGTLATSGTQSLKLYPPVAANASYAVGATYGRYAAYASSILSYWPSGGNPGTDRTTNGINLSLTNSPATAAGKSGNGTSYVTGSSTYASSSSASLTNLPATHNFAVVGWIRPTVADGSSAAWSFEGTDDLVLYPNDTAPAPGGARVFWRDVGGSMIAESGPDLSNTWAHYAFVSSASNAHRVVRNGSTVGSSVATGAAGPFTTFYLGCFSPGSQHITATLDEMFVLNAAPSNAWITQEYRQTNDQAAYWGTPLVTVPISASSPVRSLASSTARSVAGSVSGGVS